MEGNVAQTRYSDITSIMGKNLQNQANHSFLTKYNHIFLFIKGKCHLQVLSSSMYF